MHNAKQLSVFKADTKPCRKIVHVNPEFYKRIRHMVDNDMIEHGGDTMLDLMSGDIIAASIQNGVFNRVDIKRGIIDWHCHPGTCRSNGECTIGMPSVMDMGLVTDGAALGNLAHMVFSREGTYVLQVKNELRFELLNNPSYAKELSKKNAKLFTNEYNAYSTDITHPGKKYKARARIIFNRLLAKASARKKKGKKLSAAEKQKIHIAQLDTLGNYPYTTFQKKYIALANNNGFCMKFFNTTVVPKFRIAFNCEFVSAGPGLKLGKKYQ
jgi:hypothetical protein